MFTMRNLGLYCVVCFGFLLCSQPALAHFQVRNNSPDTIWVAIVWTFVEKDWLCYGTEWREIGPGGVTVFETGDFNNRRNFWLMAKGPRGDLWGGQSQTHNFGSVNPAQAFAPPFNLNHSWSMNNRYVTESLFQGNWGPLRQSQFGLEQHSATHFMPAGMQSGFDVMFTPDGQMYTAWN